MRWTSTHIKLKEMYDRWNRKWFATYSFYNLEDKFGGSASSDRNYQAKYDLAKLYKKGYIVRESGVKVEYSHEWSDYPKIKLKERWRLSGKAMYELYHVLEDNDIELIDQDYADMAKAELVR